MSKVILSTVFGLAMTGSVFAGAYSEISDHTKMFYKEPCDNVPPMADQIKASVPHTTYPYTIQTLDPYALKIKCGNKNQNGPTFGCSYPEMHDWTNHATLPWHVYVNSLLDKREYDCTILYEESHMAPWNWFDGKLEYDQITGKHLLVWPKTRDLFP